MNPDRRRFLAAGLRRFAQLAIGAVFIITVLSLAMGLIFGHSALRSIAIGFYLTASILVILGFFHAHRGPLRRSGDLEDISPMEPGGPIRSATLREREDALSSSGVFVSLGAVLFLIGVIFDSFARS